MKKTLNKISFILTITYLNFINIVNAEDLSFGSAENEMTITPDSFDRAAERTMNVGKLFNLGEEQAYYADGTAPPIELVIIRIIDTLMAIIGSVALLIIIAAGIMIITSPGNETQRSKAIEMIQGAIIALIIAFSAFIITTFVQGLFY